MNRLKGILLGTALVLPLAATGAIGATGEVTAKSEMTTMTSVQSGPEGRCCWVFYMGNWWCFVC